MSSERLTGKLVTHHVFEKGTVINLEEGILTVEFQTCGVKRFLYPTVFECHLTMCDEKANACVQKDLAIRKAAVEMKQALDRRELAQQTEEAKPRRTRHKKKKT